MPKGGRSVKRSFLLKTLLIAALAMILMLPVAMIRDLVAERQARRNEAVSGIAEGWGKRQTVAGPYLAIPYERHWTVVKRETVDGKLREIRTERSESQVVRLPAASVEWTVDAEISEKARGIYKARLYGAKLQAQGAFSLPARAGLEAGARRKGERALRLKLRAVEARLVDAACFLADLRIDGPFDARRRQAHHLRLAALGADLAQLAVDGFALHYGPMALVGDGEIRAGDRLALAPALGDAGNGLVAPRLPLGDQVADHRDRKHEDHCENCDEQRLQQKRALHGSPLSTFVDLAQLDAAIWPAKGESGQSGGESVNHRGQ